MAESVRIALEFNQIKDLFAAPEYDPFDKNSYEIAGLDIIANYLKAQTVTASASVLIYLPPEQITPELPAQFQEALQRFKNRRIIANKNEMLANKRDGWRMATYSVILVVLITLLSLIILYVIDNGIIQQALTPILTIVLWVIIWQPVEALFFENRKLRHMNYVWKKVAEIPFEFKPSPAPADGIGATGITID